MMCRYMEWSSLGGILDQGLGVFLRNGRLYKDTFLVKWKIAQEYYVDKQPFCSARSITAGTETGVLLEAGVQKATLLDDSHTYKTLFLYMPMELAYTDFTYMCFVHL